MYYVLHEPGDLEEVEKNILPFLENREYNLLNFPTEKNFEPEPDAVFITYLDDKMLRQFIPFAADKKWATGVSLKK